MNGKKRPYTYTSRKINISRNFDYEDCKKIEDDTMKRCEDAVEFARNSEFPKPEEVFEDMWANPIPLP